MDLKQKAELRERVRQYANKRFGDSTSGQPVDYGFDWSDIADLAKKLWRPGKWKKLAQELVSKLQDLWAFLQTIWDELQEIRNLLEKLFDELKTLNDKLQSDDGGDDK